MRIVLLPLAVEFTDEPDPSIGALTRAIPREIADRIAGAGGVEPVFRPFLHQVEGKRRYGVYPRRWPEKDLKRFLAAEASWDLVVHGEADFGDPFRITLEALCAPGLTRVAEESFEGPRFDGFSVVEAASRFVLRAAGVDKAPDGIGEFPARKFRAWLSLIRGRDAAARLDPSVPVEDPDSVFEPFFDALDEEPGLDAARDELALLAASASEAGLLPVEACEKAVRRLLEGNKRCSVGFAALGQIRESRGDPVEAEEALRKAVDVEPGRASLRFALGTFLVRQGRLSRAGKILETVKADPQLGTRVLLDLGSVRAAKGDTEGAIGFWREAVERDPEFVPAWANLGRILVRLGRFDEAEEAFDKGFALPNPPFALRQACGVYLAEQNRYKEGIAHLVEALKLDGTDPVAHFHIGRCYEAEGNKTHALHHLRRALKAGGEIGDRAAEILSEFTNVDRERKLLEMLNDAVSRPPHEQVVLLKAMLKEEAKFPEIHVRLGLALLAEKKPRAAAKQFKKAIRMVPENPEPWSGLATALKVRRRWSAAVEAHKEAIERAPLQPAYHVNYADTLSRMNRPAEAAAELAEARRLTS